MDAEPRLVSQVALSGRESVEAALRAYDSGGSFRVLSATPGLEFRQVVAHAGAATLASGGWSGVCAIAAESDRFRAQVFFAGKGMRRTGRAEAAAGAGAVLLLPPATPDALSGRDLGAASIAAPWPALRACAERLVGRALPDRIALPPPRPRGADLGLAARIEALIREVAAGLGSASDGARRVAAIEERALLLVLEGPLAGVLDRFAPRALAGRRALRRALDFIDAHAAEPLTLAEIADAANLSVRALQNGFRVRLGATPTAVLRAVRLDRARARLEAEDGATGVTEAALDAGFAHLGDFARAYRARYGERPVETLRRLRSGRRGRDEGPGRRRAGGGPGDGPGAPVGRARTST